MTPLVKHIEYLLHRHDCVILPGLGALLVVRRPAVINESWAMATPPARTLCFNSAIGHNDGLLATSVARMERISYAEALLTVEKTVEEYRAALHADGELRLTRLGVLKMDGEGSVTFSPFRPDSLWGLGNVPLPRQSMTADSQNSGRGSDPRYLQLRISRRALKVAACLALVIMAALSFVLPDTVSVKRDYASVLPIEPPASVVAPQPAPIAELPGTIPATSHFADMDTDRFFVVVGVFRNMKDCELFVAQHPGWSSRMQILGSGKNNFRVVVDAAPDRQTIAERLRTNPQGSGIRAEFPQAWIWERK